MKCFSAEITAKQKDMARIYKYVILAGLNPPPSLKTYEIPKGALRYWRVLLIFPATLKFVSMHGRLFTPYLTEHSIKLYAAIRTYCTHINRSLKYAAFPALET